MTKLKVAAKWDTFIKANIAKAKVAAEAAYLAFLISWIIFWLTLIVVILLLQGEPLIK